MAKVFKRSGSPRYYGNLRMASGKRKQIPLLQGKTDSRKLLRRLQGEQDGLQANGMTEKSQERSKPLESHLEAFKRHLQSKGATSKHIGEVGNRINRVFDALGMKQVQDLDSDRISNLLARWRRDGIPVSLEKRKGMKPKPLSIGATNHYVQSLRAFSRWLWNTNRTDNHLLRGLSIQNSKADRRHVRRALSDDELQRLIQTTAASDTTRYGLSGDSRGTLYRLAAMTGLRASELQSLTPQSVDLQARTIRVEAAHSKNRNESVLPLHDSLIGPLKAYLAGRDTSDRLFPGVWYRSAAKMLRKDLELVSIPYVDSQGRYFDFHSLRHQFISSLARNGVHPGIAQRLARHSTITLTMDVYSHLPDDDLRQALNSL